MRDHTTKPLGQVACCYMEDARNNTANSLLATGALLGMDVLIAAPEELWPSSDIQSIARELAAVSGARAHISADVSGGVNGADSLYTDVWVSMGDPDSDWDQRITQLLPYQVNSDTMKATGNPHVKFMHCLPALHNTETDVRRQLHHRSGLFELEVTDEVFESPGSIVFAEAENRLHTIKAVIVASLGR